MSLAIPERIAHADDHNSAAQLGRFLDSVSPYLTHQERAEALSDPVRYAWYVVPKLAERQAAAYQTEKSYRREAGREVVHQRFTVGSPLSTAGGLDIRVTYGASNTFPDRLVFGYVQPTGHGYDRYVISMQADETEVHGVSYRGGKWHYSPITDRMDRHTILQSAMYDLCSKTL